MNRNVTRYYVRWERVKASPAADHLRASVAAAFWPTTACAGVIVGFALLLLTRGEYATWGGFEPIPTGGVTAAQS